MTFLAVIPTTAKDHEIHEARSRIQQLSELKIPGKVHVKVVRSDDAMAALLDLATDSKHGAETITQRPIKWVQQNSLCRNQRATHWN